MRIEWAYTGVFEVDPRDVQSMIDEGVDVKNVEDVMDFLDLSPAELVQTGSESLDIWP